MPAALSLLTSKVFWASLILVAMATLTGYFWFSNSHLEAQVAALTAKVDGAQITIDEKTKAAQLCSDNTKDLVQREQTLATQLKSAQETASAAAVTHTAKAAQILSTKPTAKTDADSANALLNSLISGDSK